MTRLARLCLSRAFFLALFGALLLLASYLPDPFATVYVVFVVVCGGVIAYLMSKED